MANSWRAIVLMMFTFMLAKLNSVFFACTIGSGSFFFFPHWWEYLKKQKNAIGQCVPVINFPHDILLIGLAVLDMLLRLAGFVAVISIMVAGAQLVLSEGNVEKATSSRNRLINSLIGLAVAVTATALVAMIGNVAGGSTTASGLPKVSASNSTITSFLNIGFAVVGALTFLFIVIAGLRIILSGDNPTKVAEARRQIIYAAAGLLLIALASAIVNFVLKGL